MTFHCLKLRRVWTLYLGPAGFLRAGPRIDFTLLKPFRKGFENILIMTDVYSKLPVAVPIWDQQALTVAEVLVTEWFYKYWVPGRLHSNQDRSFEST